MSDIIHRHTRSTASEGKKMLIRVALTLTGFWLIGYFVFPEILASDDWFVGFGIGMVCLAAVVAIIYALVNIANPGVFVCELDQHEFRCHIPIKGVGENFRLKIRNIEKIEQHSDSTDGFSWYIWDSSGNRYRLTENYGNPVSKFVKLILKMNKNIEEIRT